MMVSVSGGSEVRTSLRSAQSRAVGGANRLGVLTVALLGALTIPAQATEKPVVVCLDTPGITSTLQRSREALRRLDELTPDAAEQAVASEYAALMDTYKRTGCEQYACTLFTLGYAWLGRTKEIQLPQELALTAEVLSHGESCERTLVLHPPADYAALRNAQTSLVSRYSFLQTHAQQSQRADDPAQTSQRAAERTSALAAVKLSLFIGGAVVAAIGGGIFAQYTLKPQSNCDYHGLATPCDHSAVLQTSAGLMGGGFGLLLSGAVLTAVDYKRR